MSKKIKLKFSSEIEHRKFIAHLRMTSDEVSTWPEWKAGSRSHYEELQMTRVGSELTPQERKRIKEDLKHLIRQWVTLGINPRASEINNALSHALMDLVEEEIEPDLDWRLKKRSDV